VMIGARAADRAWASDDPGALRTAVEVARGVPPENQPALSVVVDVAGGRRVATPVRRALHATPDAALVVASNRYDDRVLTVRVVQRDGRDHELGSVQVTLGELLSRGRVALRQGPLARVELVAAPTDAPEGTLTGLAPEGVASAAGTQPAPPKR
jgi:hypothetical protein